MTMHRGRRLRFRPLGALVVLLLALGLVLVYLFVWPDYWYRRACKTYAPGTPARVILAKYHGKYELKRTGVVYGRDISEADKRGGFFYALYLPEEWAYISFNYYEEVIRVDKAWGGWVGKLASRDGRW